MRNKETDANTIMEVFSEETLLKLAEASSFLMVGDEVYSSINFESYFHAQATVTDKLQNKFQVTITPEAILFNVSLPNMDGAYGIHIPRLLDCAVKLGICDKHGSPGKWMRPALSKDGYTKLPTTHQRDSFDKTCSKLQSNSLLSEI